MCSSEWLRSQQLNWWENNKKIKWFLFRIRIMVLNASFNNISVIFLSRQSILLVEKTALPGENHIPVASHSQIIYCCIEYTSPWAGFELTTLVVIGTDCIGSCKSNYHTITSNATSTQPAVGLATQTGSGWFLTASSNDFPVVAET